MAALTGGEGWAQRSLKVEAAAQAPSSAERRLALVIGNAAYASAPLRNPVNDARAISQALKGVGFSVRTVENATEAGMRRAIRAFGDDLAKGGTGLFYYAGHGMQVRGRNYLIPVNADIQREDEVEDQAVDANLVLSKMDSAKNALNVVILDACRNNPFARSFRSAAQGLAQMDAPSGTLIAFATAPGSVAADGDGQNGLYTEHLLRAIREPGLPIEQLFKQVRIGVTRATQDRQIPWESSSLKGDFYFVAPKPGVTAEEMQRAQQAAVEQALKGAEERAAREREEFARQAAAERDALQRQAATERAALEKKMQELMAQLLAQQQAAREDERRQRAGEAPRPVPAPPPPAVAAAPPDPPRPQATAVAPTAGTTVAESAGVTSPTAAPPTQVASIAPAAVATAAPTDPRMPSVGDEWRYATVQGGGIARLSTISIRAVLPGSILESRQEGEWVHQAGANVFGYGNDNFWLFSPYLLAFKDIKVGDRWKNVEFQGLGSCSTDPGWYCDFQAEVTARERVEVAAGTFDAFKVEVVHNMSYQSRSSHPRNTTRKGTFWYAPAAKRIVKAAHMTLYGSWGGRPVETELVSYKLR